MSVARAQGSKCRRAGLARLAPALLVTASLLAATPARGEAPAEVAIEIFPGSSLKEISLKAADRVGVVPVAILSTASLDATSVVPRSIRLAGARVKRVGGGKILCESEDANADGLPDLVCMVMAEEIALTAGDAVAVLEARTGSGQLLRGQQLVHVIADPPQKRTPPGHLRRGSAPRQYD